MRSILRFILTFLSSVVIASCLLCILFPTSLDSDNGSNHQSEGGWFPFRDPAALFSPTATISLTDDNSTFFNAKPAAFGPSLPSIGLDGQVWIGSGFGDDNVNRKGMASTMEGELGCADIPGWSEGDWLNSHRQDLPQLKVSTSQSKRRRRPVSATEDPSKSHRSVDDQPLVDIDEDDGTDDHLHYPLHETYVVRNDNKRTPQIKGNHADIQSLQEAAEIQGKVVMLSRGGCGFSEKIKWAQRRGASAVIVADNVRGGPLVRMYARTDVSNITIPSLFTSHTTAHLLSHLIPAFQVIETPITTEGLVSMDAPMPSPTLADSIPGPDVENANAEIELRFESGEKVDVDASGRSFLSALGIPMKPRETKVVAKDSQDDNLSIGKKLLRAIDFDGEDDSKSGMNDPTHKLVGQEGFVIGVQDWRDPDVVHLGTKAKAPVTSTGPTSTSTASKGHLRGGSITPSSGEYSRPKNYQIEAQASHKALTQGHQADQTVPRKQRSSWFTNLFGFSSTSADQYTPPADDNSATTLQTKSGASHSAPSKTPDIPEQHVGLWVTLTPTDMSTSPFFNTLFVLVISPLFTLAVVYSMLLLRARIRQRAWRAPKSVVERLPVRVYQALSSRTSPISEVPEATASITTPLLASARPTNVPAHPRSRPSSEAEASSSVPTQYGSLGPSGISTAELEKTASGLAEWRRKYGAKQKECVVCLEEYIDGVSRVMSLPCGHDFHVDCITPWLTTRRRICPICKGDVVRSLARASAANREDQPSDADAEDEDIQQQAAESRNMSPSAALPIPEAQATDADLERADSSYVTSYSEPNSPSSSWLSRNVSRGLDYFGVQHHDRDQPPLDRNR